MLNPPVKEPVESHRRDGFHHSIQFASLLNVMLDIDSIFLIQSPRYDAW